jgi:hypothetical protein
VKRARLVCAALCAAAAARAAPPPAPASASAAPDPTKVVAPSCTERVPSGKARPKFSERFPARGETGHALALEVSMEHGPAETLLPTGFRVQADSPEAKALKASGFVVPHPDGGAGPKITRSQDGPNTKTTAVISFVPLPEKPGRQELELPPVPITLARASGELVTVCTAPHRVVLEDPIANTPDPKPRNNPKPRRQLEVWTAAKNAAGIALVALVVGGLLAWLIGKWLRRPRPAPPAPPPRPPWEVALEALHDLRHAGLTTEGRFAEHFDRVSDVIRRYLGDRYGFDGLESTTREAMNALRQVSPYIAELGLIETVLRDADLVKFARLTPSEEECMAALMRAEDIIHKTMPRAPVAPAPSEPPPDAPSGGERHAQPEAHG